MQLWNINEIGFVIRYTHYKSQLKKSNRSCFRNDCESFLKNKTFDELSFISILKNKLRV